jgi:Glycoside hydrolase family 44
MRNRSRSGWIALVGWLWAIAGPALAITPDNPGPGDVLFTINSGQNVRAISPYIYGSNFYDATSLTAPVTLDRLGGNRWTGYNWETNYSNAGSDYQQSSDNYLVNFQTNTPPGEAVRPTLEAAAANDRGLVVTVPMAGYVSADANGTVTVAQTAPSSRWLQVVAKKSTIPGAGPLSLSPNKTDNYVFTDEYVNWVESTKQPGQPVFYDLDNEPGIWNETHPRLHPADPTFAELRDKTIETASAIKDVNPDAIVFGGVGYGWNDFRSLQDAPDQTSSPSHPGGDHPGELNYYEWLLSEVAAAEATQGRTLMDVLDMHWYPEAQGVDHDGVSRRITFDTTNANDPGMVAARVQAPRSLWDPTYTETSWITDCCSGGPIKLLPNVERDIDDFKPGTKMAISEYNYGGGNDISGGIAEADVLGILGSQGVFAATWWDLGDGSSFVNGALNMYLNYDGAGGAFGDTSVEAQTDDIAASAVYASVDSSDPNRMIVVAINRTGSDQSAAIQLDYDRVFDHAEIYRLTSGSSDPVRGADVELNLVNAMIYSMPAWSVTTLVLISDGLPGDYNHDGTVDAADYTVWRDSVGQMGDMAADGNEDNIVDERDFLLWRDNFGRSEPGSGAGTAAVAVPEPGTLVLVAGCALMLVLRQRRSQ